MTPVVYVALFCTGMLAVGITKAVFSRPISRLTIGELCFVAAITVGTWTWVLHERSLEIGPTFFVLVLGSLAFGAVGVWFSYRDLLDH